jgi:hypothetical protein
MINYCGDNVSFLIRNIPFRVSKHKCMFIQFVHIYTVHHFHFHFIVPTGALNIKRNFNTIVLVSTLCFKTLQIFNLKTSFQTLVKTLVDHRRSSYMFRITCIHHQGVCIIFGWSCDYNLNIIHLVVCLTTGPRPLPNRALHIVRSSASSKCE